MLETGSGSKLFFFRIRITRMRLGCRGPKKVVGPESIRIRVRIPLCDNQIIVLNLFLFVRNFIYLLNIYFSVNFIVFQKSIKMKIEEVKSTVKTQRISAHTHIKGTACAQWSRRFHVWSQPTKVWHLCEL